MPTPLPLPSPPHLVFDNFLGADRVEALLGFALERRDDFAPAAIRHPDPLFDQSSFRNCLRLRVPEPLRSEHGRAVGAILERSTAAFGMQTLSSDDNEIEMVCTNDGGFYRTHDDTSGRAGKRTVRALTCVYYFHRRPKGFEGGELRLYSPIPGASKQHADIAPESDRLVVFPAFFPHEARPVRCESRLFEDSRFSINCWIYKTVLPSPEDRRGTP